MSRLTEGQLDLLHRYLDKALGEIADAGFILTVEDDFEAWTRFMAQAPGIASVSSTFDPKLSLVNPSNAFWLAVRKPDGEIVACNCTRLFITENLINIVRSYHLFFDRKPVLSYKPLDLSIPEDMPLLSGRITFIGGLWIHPDYRGCGLIHYLPRLGRTLALRHFDVDWSVGTIRDTDKVAARSEERSGATSSFPFLQGYYPPKYRNQPYRLCYTSRLEILQQARHELEVPTYLALPESLAAGRLTAPQAAGMAAVAPAATGRPTEPGRPRGRPGNRQTAA